MPGLVGAAAIALCGLAVRDYRQWYALGPGGVPHNLYGWLLVTAMRAITREPRDIAPFARLLGVPPDRAWLAELPHRTGPRPRVNPQPIPHRQLDQLPDTEAKAANKRHFDHYVQNNPLVTYQRSHFEKQNDAITLRRAIAAEPEIASPAHGEIAHIHPSDGSMHMVLSPSDATTVLRAGWGERHSLAGRLGGLPLTYLLIYAPRDTTEIQVVASILRAAADNMIQPPARIEP